MRVTKVPPTRHGDWDPVGRTANTAYFRAAPDVLIVIPDEGLKDDAESARANVAFQTRFASQSGRRCAVVVRMTSLLSQDGEARRVYAKEMKLELFFAAALVASNAISRAIASFFLGLTKPAMPTRVFEDFDAALGWVDEMRRRSSGGAAP